MITWFENLLLGKVTQIKCSPNTLLMFPRFPHLTGTRVMNSTLKESAHHSLTHSLTLPITHSLTHFIIHSLTHSVSQRERVSVWVMKRRVTLEGCPRGLFCVQASPASNRLLVEATGLGGLSMSIAAALAGLVSFEEICGI